MDNKNVFIAIALSMSVLLFWGAFFETPQPVDSKSAQQQKERKNSDSSDSITPNIDQTIKSDIVYREDSINKVDRIKIENNNVVGSISLKGALIDDISFKNHKQNLKDNNNVEFLHPKQTKNGYYVETGWASIGNKINVPSADSTWSVEGNNILEVN